MSGPFPTDARHVAEENSARKLLMIKDKTAANAAKAAAPDQPSRLEPGWAKHSAAPFGSRLVGEKDYSAIWPGAALAQHGRIERPGTSSEPDWHRPLNTKNKELTDIQPGWVTARFELQTSVGNSSRAEGKTPRSMTAGCA